MIMARPRLAMGTRQVVPRFWDHEGLAELEHSSGIRNLRLTMIGLWAASDVLGRFEWRPKMLASKIYPYHEEDRAAVEPAMNAFVEGGYLVKYEVDGKAYGQWPHWGEHNDFRKGTSEYPAPNGGLEGVPGDSGALSPSNPSQSPLKVKVETRKSKVETEEENSGVVSPLHSTKPEESEQQPAPLPTHQFPCGWGLATATKPCEYCERARAKSNGNGEARKPRQPKKIGFDPYDIPPFDDWSTDEIRLVSCYWWEHATDRWYREHVNTPDYFRKKFPEMAARMPKGWQPPKPKRLPVAKTHKSFRPDGTEYQGGWGEGDSCPDCEGSGFKRGNELCPCTKWYLEDGTEIDALENRKRLMARA